MPIILREAVMAGDLETTTTLLKDNPDLILCRDDRGFTPLHAAVLSSRKGCEDVVQLLLANKADVNTKSNSGDSPLHTAILFSFGKKTIVEFLLNNGAEVNAKSNIGTPLHIAANRGYANIAKLLLDNNADVNALNNHGETPLHCVSTGYEAKSSDLAGLLRRRGGRDMVSGGATSADIENFIIDLVRGNLKKARALVRTNPYIVFCRCSGGYTPMHNAVSAGRRDSVEFLIANNALINDESSDGLTPLHLAAQTGRRDMAELLIDNKARMDLLCEHRTPLHFAASNGHMDVVELLLEKGMNANDHGNDGVTALHLAARKGHKDVVEVLLAHHADVNALGAEYGPFVTPLHMAVNDKKEWMAELLRQHGGHE
jgi:ankyrin repeat protein